MTWGFATGGERVKLAVYEPKIRWNGHGKPTRCDATFESTINYNKRFWFTEDNAVPAEHVWLNREQRSQVYHSDDDEVSNIFKFTTEKRNQIVQIANMFCRNWVYLLKVFYLINEHFWIQSIVWLALCFPLTFYEFTWYNSLEMFTAVKDLNLKYSFYSVFK